MRFLQFSRITIITNFIRYSTLVIVIFFVEIVQAQNYDIIIWGAGNAGISAAVSIAKKGDKVALFLDNNEEIDFTFLNDTNIRDSNLERFKNQLEKGISINQKQPLNLEASGLEIAKSLKEVFTSYDNIDYIHQAELIDVQVNNKIIESILIGDNDYSKTSYSANFFIDATAEGNLLRKAGVPLQANDQSIEDFSNLVEEEVVSAIWQNNDSSDKKEYVRAKGYFKLGAINSIASKHKERPNIQKNSIASSIINAQLEIKDNSGTSYLYPCLPFTVPYFVIVPQKVDNLLVSNAVSTTKLGQSLLSSPQLKSELGMAAGLAASLCNSLEVTAKKLPVELLQREILRNRKMIVYFNDISSESEYFEVSQYFGLRGYITTAEFKADDFLEEKTAKHWQFLSNQEVKFSEGKTTRGDFLLKLYQKIQKN